MPKTAVPAAASIDLHQSPIRLQLRRRTDDTRRLLLRTARRACSAPLALAWQFDVTVALDAEVVADDRGTAAQLIEQYLRRPVARIVVSCPSDDPIGWRDLAYTPVTGLRDVAVETDAPLDETWPWAVTAVATANFTLPARDADADLYVRIDPDPCPGMGHPIHRIGATSQRITRTPVRRRGKHR